MGVRRSVSGSLASLSLGMLACAGPNLWTDGTSVSTGAASHGRLRSPAKLARKGEGYVVPPRWSERGFQYGVRELVDTIVRAAQRVREQHRKSMLGVADLSAHIGGRSSWHVSHQSGRDVDLLFYTTDGRGRPLAPPEHDMFRFDGSGRPYHRERDPSYVDAAWQQRRFDAARNWQLVEELLSDPTIRVQWIFVANSLQDNLLRFARAHDRPYWLVEYAATVMREPAGPPHDDHMHIRIYCPRADRFHGCLDTGPIWQHEKKSFKYAGPERYDPVLWRLMTSMSMLAHGMRG